MMVCKNRAAENPEQSPNKNNHAHRDLSEQIRKWAALNPWYENGAATNQCKLERAFGEIMEALIQGLHERQHHQQRRQVFLCWDSLMAYCRQIDMVCRAGCRDPEEMLELEFLRSKAVGAAAELAEILELIREAAWARQTAATTQSPPAASEDLWITVTQAAEILEVSKSTVSKWAKEGRVRHNSMRRHRRRLSRISVLTVKQEREEDFLRQDVREIRMDAKIINKNS